MRGKKTGGKDWKPGQSGNPAGRTPLPEEIRIAKNFTAIEIQKSLSDLLRLTQGALAERINNSATPMLERIVGSIIVRAADDGCPMRLNFLFDRIVGKVKDKLEIELPEPLIIRHFESGEAAIELTSKKKVEDV